MGLPTDKFEAGTREEINQSLQAAGWIIQDNSCINLYESFGLSVRGMETDSSLTDYMLLVDGKTCGIVGAKCEGAALGHVAEQSARYATSKLKYISSSYSLLALLFIVTYMKVWLA